MTLFSLKNLVTRESQVYQAKVHAGTSRVALEEKLKFSTAIAERKKKIEQLIIQEKLGEVRAQEAVYPKGGGRGQSGRLSNSLLLSTKQYDPIPAFLSDNAEGLR